MARHVYNTDGIMERLRAIGIILKDTLVIGIFLASVDVIDMQTATAAITTLAEACMTSEDATSGLIEEIKTPRGDYKSGQK